MNKTLLATIAIPLAYGAGLATPLPESVPDKVVTIEGAQLEALDAECLAEIKQVEGDPVSCSTCETVLGNDPAKGWCCNKAYMSVRVQRCLTAAMGG